MSREAPSSTSVADERAPGHIPGDMRSAADTPAEETAVDETPPEPELQLQLETDPEPGSEALGAAVSQAQRAVAEAKKTEGNAAFKSKRYKQAIGFYTEAAQLDPTCAIYFCNRSTCYANLGDWKGAPVLRAPLSCVRPCLACACLVLLSLEFAAAQRRCMTPRKPYRSTRAT